MTHQISFPETSFETVSLPDSCKLSDHLTVLNSPLLFGCRTGVCGTCIIEIAEGQDGLTASSDEEKEALEIYAPSNSRARLACQILLNCDIAIKKINAYGY